MKNKRDIAMKVVAIVALFGIILGIVWSAFLMSTPIVPQAQPTMVISSEVNP